MGLPELSVVVPLLNEEANAAELVRQVREALDGFRRWELILVDDGSTDRTPEIIQALALDDPRIRPVLLARRYGQSTAMQAGFDQARGEVVVTLDGDLQNDPRDIPGMVEKLREGYDLVVGYRVRRKDHLIRRKIPSWVANRIIRAITGVPVRDNGCSLKAYSGGLIRQVRLYSDMHRFIPAIAAGTAGASIAEMPVNHRPRVAGVSKYGISRVLRVLADLVSVKMIRSFRECPLLLFSILAAWAAAVGGVFLVAAIVAQTSFRMQKAAAMVLPGAALLWFALTAFLLLLGLVGEVAVRRSFSSRSGSLAREVK